MAVGLTLLIAKIIGTEHGGRHLSKSARPKHAKSAGSLFWYTGKIIKRSEMVGGHEELPL